MTEQTTESLVEKLGYDPSANSRELARHYISASEEDIQAMLEKVGASSFSDLFSHIKSDFLFQSELNLPDELSYEELIGRLESIANKNHHLESYLGDGLLDCTVHEIVPYVSSLRNLSTAYTPYQPERSQGTLMTHWIYQSLMSMLTGFEAINSSLYDRSTAIFEAICSAIRLQRNADTALVPESIFPQDIEVLKTLVADTNVRLEFLPLDPATGRINLSQLKEKAEALGDKLACIVFPHVNCLGLLEDVDSLTNLCTDLKVKSIASIDPFLIASGALKPPVAFGASGVDMIVGEGQHLAMGPNFGGPGLGLFGIRYNDEKKNDIRVTAGRYVGKATDFAGRDCRVMVLSTREQHIRKDKATSNICSNQAFLATLAGAALLARGESGTSTAASKARQQAQKAFEGLTAIPGVKPAYIDAPFFNEITLEIPISPKDLVDGARKEGILVGQDVSSRVEGNRNLIKLSFTDKTHNISRLVEVVAKILGQAPLEKGLKAPQLNGHLRTTSAGLPEFSTQEVKEYYNKLAELNVSPDDACYPLGSCTMKYNPFINDWAANLPGFTDAHPLAPTEDVQGSLEILFEIQEWFKGITGLAGVTTQPVAGAQGELVGLKMFQAYHRDRGESHRNVIFIPKSSHGTNFATAAMAGFETKTVNGEKSGIIYLEADSAGRIDLDDLETKLAEFGPRLCGIMVTNPNTSGVFETEFREIADKVHAVGGLVYMDGANMNAIAGWVNLNALGVDAVHNNLHKTWTIPHGGGGPGDAIVAVSETLVDYLPGHQVRKEGDQFIPFKTPKSIGSFHRHWGNFAHKVRCYAYLLRLGREGVRRMSGMAVLSSRYLFEELRTTYPTLPADISAPKMHEFILTLSEETFELLEKNGVPKASAISRIGKLFLDFGFHAPTVAWPETFGLMIEPTESYTKEELDRFAKAVITIHELIHEKPEVLLNTPYFTPVDRIDDVAANRKPVLFEQLEQLPELNENRLSPAEIARLPVEQIYDKLKKLADSTTATN